jgi:hypothetical protein
VLEKLPSRWECLPQILFAAYSVGPAVFLAIRLHDGPGDSHVHPGVNGYEAWFVTDPALCG